MALERAGHEAFEADGVKRGLIEAGPVDRNLLFWISVCPTATALISSATCADGRQFSFWCSRHAAVMRTRSRRWTQGPTTTWSNPLVRANLWRAFGPSSGVTPSQSQLVPVIRFGDVRIDLAHRVVERHGQPVHLTPIEYSLLTRLATQPNRVVTHLQLLKIIRGPGHTEDNHYVRVHMANLRKKIEADASMPRYIITESGIGYRFAMGA